MMRRAVLLLLLALPLAADDVMTNADVVKLVKAGLSAETIEAKIAASQTKFDTSTDALVALAGEGVPDRVVRAMIQAKPGVAPASRRSSPENRPEAGATRAKAAPARRYEVAIHSDKYAKCDNGQLRIDANGVQASGCRKLDFKAGWADIKSACYEYGFRGTVLINDHRISTVTPAEAKKIVEHLQSRVAVAACAAE